MDTLTTSAATEFTVKGSRFLAELLPCAMQGDARSILKAQKTKYADATHVVHAFITGAAGEVRGLSDDGEPSGTAGRPVMDVLSGRGCTNVMLTVARWFGGTLLGTGGLVRAYSDAAKAVIAKADADGAFEALVATAPFCYQMDYADYNAVKMLLPRFHLSGLSREFGDAVMLSGKVEEDAAAAFASAVRDATGGRALESNL